MLTDLGVINDVKTPKSYNIELSIKIKRQKSHNTEVSIIQKLRLKMKGPTS